MTVKMLAYSCCLVLEVVLFTYIYMGGARGFVAIRSLQRECSGISSACKGFAEDVIALREQVTDWEQYPDLRELRIRTDVQMSDPAATWYRYRG